jgi:D-alanine-D-alanine ligase
MKIVVLAGGLSPERDVSLSSGSLIANALLENGHQVLLWDVFKKIELKDSYEDLFYKSSQGQRFSYTVPENEPDLEAIKREYGNWDALIGENVDKICKYADLVFIALHGSIGENGQLQALFDILGIKYTGTGYFGSFLAMNKDVSKRMMVANDIKTPEWIVINCSEENIPAAIEYPCVVKPSNCGSSIGVTIVNNDSEFHKALDFARAYADTVLIEEYIAGREFSVGILGDEALPVIEIIPKTGFYDYKNKYQAGLTEEICPARLSPQLTERIQEIALRVHKVLKLGYYSRIDFIMDNNNEFYCLEANTLPGMTPTSLLPQEALAIGISYNELCERIVKASLER